jgi:prolipoprotein diacylglyceryl transferase
MESFGLLPFLVIEIHIDPTIGTFGPFTLTWHGVFSAIGIIAGVTLAVWLAKRDGIPSEVGQEVALVAVPCAVLGARLFYVFEHFGDFRDEPWRIITGLNEGGITLYGGLIGGVLGGAVYGLIRKWPVAIGMDAAAPGMILGQAIGRIGDLINGEHLATESHLPWAVRYTHPNTLAELGKPVHPTAGGYELVGDLLILAFLLLVARRYLKQPGWVFCTYAILYSSMRFVLSFFRVDEQTIPLLGQDVPVPQVTAVVVIGVAVMLAGFFVRHPGPITEEYARRVWGEVPAEPRSGERAPAQA